MLLVQIGGDWCLVVSKCRCCYCHTGTISAAWARSHSDIKYALQVADELVRAHLESADTPWEALRCLVGEATYGGRITDERDRRVVAAYLGRLFCEAAMAPGAALTPPPGYIMPDAVSLAAVKVWGRDPCLGRNAHL